MRVVAEKLQIYYNSHLARKRRLSPEDCHPPDLIEVQDLRNQHPISAQNIEIDKINAAINDFKVEIIEKLKTDIEKSEERILTKLRED